MQRCSLSEFSVWEMELVIAVMDKRQSVISETCRCWVDSIFRYAQGMVPGVSAICVWYHSFHWDWLRSSLTGVYTENVDACNRSAVDGESDSFIEKLLVEIRYCNWPWEKNARSPRGMLTRISNEPTYFRTQTRGNTR